MIHTWLIILAIAVGVAFIAEKVKQPYPTFLVITGLIIGAVDIPIFEEVRHVATNDTVFQTAIITIFLAALLGDATIKLPFREINKNRKPIVFLALVGTFLTFLLISTLSFYLLPMTLQQAIIFGAVMSATDPISVLAIFKSMKLNKKLSIIVEGESLGNDGVAVVLFKVALVTTALTFGGVLDASLEFLKSLLGGMVVGAIIGFLASRITKRIDQHLIEIGLSILVFYGAFEIAELEIFHFSGVIAVVTAGLIFGNYGKKIGMSAQTLREMDSFWEVIAFIANAFIFIMVGMEVARIGFEGQLSNITLSIVIVVISRLIAIFIGLSFDKSIPTSWKWVVGWGGLKGSLSIALILSIAPSFEGKDFLLTLTFSNVLFSLLGQGMTIKPLVRFLKVK